MARVKWELEPDAQDYPAASAYLSLLVADPALRDVLVAQLQAAPIVHYKAKDLLRASALPLLPANNTHVADDLQKVRKRRPLSPILLVRGDLVRGFPLQIADGYHRVCASYFVMENTDIPCRLIDLPAAAPARSAVTAAKAAPVRAAVTPGDPAPPEEPAVPPLRKTVKTAPVKKALPAKKAAPAKQAAPAKKVAVKKAAVKQAVAKQVDPTTVEAGPVEAGTVDPSPLDPTPVESTTAEAAGPEPDVEKPSVAEPPAGD